MTPICKILMLSLSFLILVSVADATQSQEQPEQRPNGAQLYQQHCASCHNKLDKTTKAQRSVSRLRSSIEQFPSMNYLSFLTEQDLEAIATSLKTVRL